MRKGARCCSNGSVEFENVDLSSEQELCPWSSIKFFLVRTPHVQQLELEKCYVSNDIVRLWIAY